MKTREFMTGPWSKTVYITAAEPVTENQVMAHILLGHKAIVVTESRRSYGPRIDLFTPSREPEFPGRWGECSSEWYLVIGERAAGEDEGGRSFWRNP